jgi:hypothetical protein
MPQYRIYHLDVRGQVGASEWIDAPGDTAAIEAARAHSSVQCELWQGRRLVTRLDRSPTDSTSASRGDNRPAARV